MFRSHCAAVVSLLFAFLLAVGCGHTPPPDLTKPLQGTWELVDASGKPVGKEIVINQDRFSMMSVKARGETTTTEIGSAGVESAVIQLNPTQPEIDFVYVDGVHQGKAKLGIFAIEADTLKISVGEVGGPRPTEFTSDSRTTLLVMKKKP